MLLFVFSKTNHLAHLRFHTDKLEPLGQKLVELWYWKQSQSDRWWKSHEIYFPIKALRQRQNGHHFADNIFKCISSNDNAWISLTISLKFVSKVGINNIPALVQIMAWRRPCDKPLPEPTMVSLLMHICFTRPQWVKARTKWGGFTDIFNWIFFKEYTCIWIQISLQSLFRLDMLNKPA